MSEVVTSNTARIEVVLGQLPRRWGGKAIRFTSGFISIQDLIPRVKVAFRRHSTSSGYQREPSRTRVRRLANAIARQHVDLPTALLLNLREFNPDSDLVAVDGANRPKSRHSQTDRPSTLVRRWPTSCWSP